MEGVLVLFWVLRLSSHSLSSLRLSNVKASGLYSQENVCVLGSHAVSTCSPPGFPSGGGTGMVCVSFSARCRLQDQSMFLGKHFCLFSQQIKWVVQRMSRSMQMCLSLSLLTHRVRTCVWEHWLQWLQYTNQDLLMKSFHFYPYTFPCLISFSLSVSQIFVKTICFQEI